jgi:alginate O-acetyltransferase complex protein AlgJ
MFSKKYISFIFLLFLWAPFLVKTLNLSKSFEKKESGENRALKQFPEMGVTDVDSFPSLYEAHFNDYFILRNTFIDLFHSMRVKCFRESPLPEKVIIGKDNWLYLADEMPTYNRTARFFR